MCCARRIFNDVTMEELQEAVLLSLWSLAKRLDVQSNLQWWNYLLSVEVWPRICHGLLAASLRSLHCDGTGHSVWAVYF